MGHVLIVEKYWKEYTMRTRKANHAGSFYPNGSKELEKMLVQMSVADESRTAFKNIKALIAPHAGYIYSGFTANKAYNVAHTKAEPQRIVVIGPSHRVYLQGASVALYNDYETPLGNIAIDYDFTSHLKDKFDCLCFNPLAHTEHSTETQMPFIKKYFPNAEVVEIVYGDIATETLSEIIREIMLQSQNFIVISTDLSHFYSQEEANLLDARCIKAIHNLDLNTLNDGCEACGITGVKALVQWANENGLQAEILDYQTSMNTNHDASRVVGYTSAIIGEQ